MAPFISDSDLDLSTMQNSITVSATSIDRLILFESSKVCLSDFAIKMDIRLAEMMKHLEKQNELLTEVHRSMSHELHKLQVEEEMLMRKFYELMTAQGFTKKKKEDSANATDNQEIEHTTTSNEKNQNVSQ